jgi:cysteine desulfurase/selenocysteine lyase
VASLDVDAIRREFPILHQEVRGKPLVYLDNAATTQKPRAVIDALAHYYERDNSNIHRGVHALSELATAAYEGAREKARAFLGARDGREIVFVRGTTEAINLVAQTFGRSRVKPGDEILISHMEHHSNIVPWQLLAEQTGAVVRVAPITDEGELDLEAFASLINDRTKLVSIVHVSNALGTVNPVKKIVELAHAAGVPVLLDGAQASARLPVDVVDLDCDFYTVSGHKVYGPTGIGVLYGKLEHLDAMPPWQGGGEMIRTVSFEKTEYNRVPWKFEAGTPNIAGTVGLGAAFDFMTEIGLDVIEAHENELLLYGTEVLSAIPGVTIFGTAREKAGVLSFLVEGAHPHDIGTIIDREGVAIRAGHHCAQPVMARFGVPATARASFGVYNTTDEIDALARALGKVREIFG